MADADIHDALKRSALPPLIPGIYNYCDHRCERCPFSQRCLSYLARERAGDDEPGDVLTRILRERQADALEPPEEVLDVISEIAERAESMTSEELERLQWEDNARVERATVDRLVVAARRYTLSVWNVIRALEPLVVERGDPLAIEAVETIAALASLVASKTYRAVSGSLDADFNPSDLDSDANGSAKVARLVAGESRRAWSVLTEIGRAAADGVPAGLVRVLDEIDAGLATRFPQAMSFVRPGFDTEGRSP